MAANFKPPYADAGNTPSLSENEIQKLQFLSNKWDMAHKFLFPNRLHGSVFRRLKAHWFDETPWLRYSSSQDSVVCAPCYLFGQREKSKNVAFSTKPIKDWSNLTKLIKIHEHTDIHKESTLAGENFILIMSGEKKDIRSSISTAYADVIVKNRRILTSIIETIILCGRQNIALRGHDEETSNFVAILHDKAKHDKVLEGHLAGADPRAKYTSPLIQNEIIKICGDMIRQSIVDTCINAQFFGFIADEATDAATLEQTTLCVRFYDCQKHELREDFLGFSECESTTGESLANAFVTILTDMGLDIQNIRGQGYDGAANMSGRHKGVKSRIQEQVPQALYTHCKAHNLNLAIIHASEDIMVRNMFDIVQQVTFHFNYSAKRNNNFKNSLKIDEVASDNMHGRTKLRSLCETRWSARADSLFTFKAAYSSVCSSLDDLAANFNDPKSGMLLNAITRFDFIVAVVAVEHILSNVAPLSLLLQKKEMDLLTASREAGVIVDVLTAERGDEAVWETLYEQAVDMARTQDIQPSLPRNRGRQQNRPNAPAQDPSTYWKINMYFVFLDHLVQEMQDRLLDAKDRFLVENLVPSHLHKLQKEDVSKLFDTFQPDLKTDRNGFDMEVRRWKAMWEPNGDVTKPTTLAATLPLFSHDLYPNIAISMRVVLCMPVTTASAERSFSTMRQVKTYLRATMTTERLAGLALMTIYREKQLNVDSVIDKFASMKDRRLSLLFKV